MSAQKICFSKQKTFYILLGIISLSVIVFVSSTLLKTNQSTSSRASAYNAPLKDQECGGGGQMPCAGDKDSNYGCKDDYARVYLSEAIPANVSQLKLPLRLSMFRCVPTQSRPGKGENLMGLRFSVPESDRSCNDKEESLSVYSLKDQTCSSGSDCDNDIPKSEAYEQFFKTYAENEKNKEIFRSLTESIPAGVGICMSKDVRTGGEGMRCDGGFELKNKCDGSLVCLKSVSIKQIDSSTLLAPACENKRKLTHTFSLTYDLGIDSMGIGGNVMKEKDVLISRGNIATYKYFTFNNPDFNPISTQLVGARIITNYYGPFALSFSCGTYSKKIVINDENLFKSHGEVYPEINSANIVLRGFSDALSVETIKTIVGTCAYEQRKPMTITMMAEDGKISSGIGVIKFESTN